MIRATLIGMTRFFSILLYLGLAVPAAASECPAAPDHSSQTDAVIARIQKSADAVSAKQISNEVWQYYADAPDDTAQEMLDSGMRKRASWDLLSALDDFDRLVAYCPNYAEGFNQRAFVNFLRGDFEAALPDLERALELNPRHIGARSGKAVSMIGLGREAEAQDAIAEALELNPWLPEGALLRPVGDKKSGEADL